MRRTAVLAPVGGTRRRSSIRSALGRPNEGATLTGQIVAEAYKKPEDVAKVNELGAQREEVKHELQTCIAQNYGGVTLQGSAEVKGQGDPDDPDDGDWH